MKILYYRRQVFYCVAILMMVTLLLLLLILLFVSCKASNDKYLEQCLILAGKNRIEFEKVLNHYKNDPLFGVVSRLRRVKSNAPALRKAELCF